MSSDDRTKSRRGLSCGTVLAGSVAVLAIAAAVAVFGYFEYLHYERVAALHLPEETRAAARLDVEKVVFFEPVRKHLLPLLDVGRRADGRSRLARLQDKTGVALGRELREVVVARGATWADWLIIVGGRFHDADIVKGLSEVLTEDGLAWTVTDGVLKAPVGGVSVGQAGDGTVIIGSSERIVRSALPRQETHVALGLERESPAGSLVISGDVIREHASGPAALVTPGLADLSRARRITGSVELTDPVTLSFAVHLADGTDPTMMKKGVELLLVSARGFSKLAPGGDFAGERAALAGATVAATDGKVVVTAPWSQGAIDRAAARIAAAAGPRLRRPGR